MLNISYEFQQNIVFQNQQDSKIQKILQKKKLNSNIDIHDKQQQLILEETQQNQNTFQNIQQQNPQLFLKETLHRQLDYHTKQCYLLENEYYFLSQLSHPNIIKLSSELKSNSKSCYFKLEKGICDMYDRTFRKDHSTLENVDLNEVRTCTKQVALALHYLHDQLNISHNDIKPENIIMFDQNLFKLADFGYAKQQEKSIIYSSDLYSKWKYRCREYMAPELIQIVNNYISSNSKKTLTNLYNNYYIDESKTDIFAFGMSIFVMVFSVLPFKTQEGAFYEDEIYQYLENQNSYGSFWMNFKDILIEIEKQEKVRDQNYRIENLKDLLQNMLCHNPKERYSIMQVINHPWLQNENNS